jgi:hypothetical protein
MPAGELGFEQFKLILTKKLGLGGAAGGGNGAGCAAEWRELPHKGSGAGGAAKVGAPEWSREFGEGTCFGEASLLGPSVSGLDYPIPCRNLSPRLM